MMRKHAKQVAGMVNTGIRLLSFRSAARGAADGDRMPVAIMALLVGSGMFLLAGRTKGYETGTDIALAVGQGVMIAVMIVLWSWASKLSEGRMDDHVYQFCSAAFVVLVTCIIAPVLQWPLSLLLVVAWFRAMLAEHRKD